jgi:hypothetical protein
MDQPWSGVKIDELALANIKQHEPSLKLPIKLLKIDEPPLKSP